MDRVETTGKRRDRLLPLNGEKTTVGQKRHLTGQHRHEHSLCIGDMLLDVLHHLGVDNEMVHLVYTAALLFVLMMLCVLVVQVAILCTLLKNHTNPLVVMVVHHYGREQYGESCHPKMKYV